MRTRLAFAASLAGTLVLGAPVSAQAVPSTPDLIVSVRKAAIGADLVTVSARASDYPPELIQKGLVALGERLGFPARGVEAHRESFRPGDPSATIVKGSCGVDGLVDPATGALAIAPLAQAFAGAPAPYTVRRMVVSFDGVTIGPKTIARHTAGRGSDLVFTGRSVGSSVEYNVELRSQDPARLVVNEEAAVQNAATPPARRGPDPLTVALFAGAAVAAGALVYCLILLIGRRPMSKS